MRTTKKKGFILYFDNYRWISGLSDEQRGRLFEGLYSYALATSEEGISPEEFLDRLPVMERETVMAFCFMADSIFRDTIKWRSTQETKAARREERRLTAPPAGGTSVFPPTRGF